MSRMKSRPGSVVASSTAMIAISVLHCRNLYAVAGGCQTRGR
jgi:hypothetical protein